MKLQFGKTGLLVLACALSLATNVSNSSAQERQRNISQQTEQIYVISAEAGRVNYVSGGAYVERAGLKTNQILAKTDEIKAGDAVSVGDTGKIEILLNPGSFLRLAENTDFQFIDTSLENLQMKLTRGSALIEAIAVGGDNGAEIKIATPLTGIKLEKSGIYRLNVNSGAVEVYVWKGAATVGNEVVKSGRRAVFQKGAALTVAKFDKDEKDALDIWSKDRAKELAKLNDRLQRREVDRVLSTSAFSAWNRAAFYGGFNGGFWLFNRMTGTFCYVPSGWYGFQSPYGYSYKYNVFYDPYYGIRRLKVASPVQPVYLPPAKQGGTAPVFIPPAKRSEPVYLPPAKRGVN